MDVKEYAKRTEPNRTEQNRIKQLQNHPRVGMNIELGASADVVHQQNLHIILYGNNVILLWHTHENEDIPAM